VDFNRVTIAQHATLPFRPEPSRRGGAVKLRQQIVTLSAEQAQRLIELLLSNQDVEVGVVAGGGIAVQLEREDRAFEGDCPDLVSVKEVE
jgi:hypothetical protein